MTSTPTRTLRLSRLGHALTPAVFAAALGGLAAWGPTPLLVGVAALQLLLLLAFLALVDAPAAVGVLAIGTAAAAASNVVVHVDDARVGGLAGVVALSLVGGLLQQLARRHRSRVTESLADTLVAVVLVATAACLPAALEAPGGDWLVPAGLAGLGAALVAGRLTQLLAAGLPGAGVPAALVAGTLTTALLAGEHGTSRERWLLGLAVAATAALVDVVTTLAAGDVLGHGHDRRRLASLRPVTQLLPFAVAAPVLLVAARLLDRT